MTLAGVTAVQLESNAVAVSSATVDDKVLRTTISGEKTDSPS